ncbi:type I-G CRISPR-associated protein Csb2 [Ornithinimicrobium sp. Y1847]|uniref:type I-G CRISPR-associated protein Csb2 n=1 Tax=Ornithinimicrobium sp. Y1847 TaxID=3405419 RepID=UPI003B672397
MTGFVLQATFPTGQYHGHDRRGKSEWPPSPARVLSALLATAYATRYGVEVVRELFSCDPPTITASKVGRRDGDVQRWVPVDVEFSEKTGTLGRGGLTAKLLKPPERGVVIGDGQVRYEFSKSPSNEESLQILSRVAEKVPYLGRPTSPVILVLVREPLTVELADSWTPDPRGNVDIDVPTPGFLKALDQREVDRARKGSPGYHPSLRRPTTLYRYTGQRAEFPATASPSIALAVDQVLDAAVLYPLTGVDPPDAVAVISRLMEFGGKTVPVRGDLKRRGFSEERITGVLMWDAVAEQTVVVAQGRLTELKPTLPLKTAQQRQAIAQSLARSSVWTTPAPIPCDEEWIRREVSALTDRHPEIDGSVLLHDRPRLSHAAHVSANPRLTHLTLDLVGEITGPLVLGSLVLQPPDE